MVENSCPQIILWLLFNKRSKRKHWKLKRSFVHVDSAGLYRNGKIQLTLTKTFKKQQLKKLQLE